MGKIVRPARPMGKLETMRESKMSRRRFLKPFALANTLAVFAFSLPATAQVVPDVGLGFDSAVALDGTGPEGVVPTVATRQIPAQNALYVPNPTQPIRIQLTKFDGTKASELVGTVLSIVSPDSAQTRYQVNDQGVVVFKAERPGVYAFISTGPLGHIAFPVVIRLGSATEADIDAGDDVGVTPTITLPIFTLNPGEASRAVSSFLPPSQWALSDMDGSLVATGEVASTNNYRVSLSQDGRMEGQVVTLMQDSLVRQNIEGNNLLLYQNGELLARAISDSLGRFAFEGLQPGNYGIICAGPGGYGAFGFEAIMPTLSTSTKNGETFVTTMVQQTPVDGPFSTGDVLPIVPIPLPLVSGLSALFRSDGLLEEELLACGCDIPCSPVPGCGSVGGGFGGGGAGGGMGGAGGLLGLAGLGIAAALAASDSNDRVITNPVPDPATPANVLP